MLNGKSGKTIKVTIRNGVPVIETGGFSGTDCLKATAALEAALGGNVVSADFNGGVQETQVETNYAS